MHTDLVSIIDRIAHVDSAISIKPHSEEKIASLGRKVVWRYNCLLYTSPSPRD